MRRATRNLKATLGAAAFALLAVAFIAACSDSGGDEALPTPTEGPPSVDEQAYLDEVLEIDTLIGAVVVSVEAALEGSYATRGRLFSLLDESDVHGTFSEIFVRAEALEPPERYQVDHERYLESVSESILLAEELQAAIDAEDLVEFDVKTVELFVSRGRLLVDASSSFCAGALRSEAVPGCSTTDALPGGQYGVDLRDVFRRFRADFAPRVGAFPPAMSADEIFDELNILQPPIIDAIETAIEEAGALDPPSGFAEDHAIIEQYLEDTLEVSQAISQAAEDRDSEAQRVEFGRSGEVLCAAALTLSEEANAITEFFDDSLC